ncbi:MAG: plasmid mobilization relaxosome protein MobC [Rhodospirillaceae bacterium]
MGSEERRRKHQVNVRLNDEERNALERLAAERGLSLADFTRSVLLERVPVGVSVRRRIPHHADKPLSDLSVFATAWLAELGKTGSNVNQLAHQANVGQPISHSKIAQCQIAIQRHVEIAEDFRARLFVALGINTNTET